MKPSETKLRFAMDKIVFFLLLVLGLFLAQLIIYQKTSIDLSRPITLRPAGLSISLPTGSNWKTDDQWRFQRNTFRLTSELNTGNASMAILCIYHLAPTKESTEAVFEEQAAQYDCQIRQSGQKSLGDDSLSWVHLSQTDSPLLVFFGTARLANNRRLDIAIYDTYGDIGLTENLFETIISSVSLVEKPAVRAGRAVISALKSKGISGYLFEKDAADMLFIKNQSNQVIGFLTSVMVESAEAEEVEIQAAKYYYLQGFSEQISYFESDNYCNQFIFKSESKTSNARIRTEISSDQQQMQVQQIVGKNINLAEYYLSSSAFPDVFIRQVFVEMIESGHEEIIADMIESDGTVTPVLIKQIQETNSADRNTTFTIEYFDRPDTSEQLKMNEQMQIVSGVVRQQNFTSLLERTTRDEIVRLFPERADFIKRQLMEDDPTQSQP